MIKFRIYFEGELYKDYLDIESAVSALETFRRQNKLGHVRLVRIDDKQTESDKVRQKRRK